MTLDPDLKVLSLNEEGRVLLGGYDPALIIGKTFWEASGQGIDAELADAIHVAQSEGKAQRLNGRSDATGRWYEIGIYPGFDRSVVLSFRNVTDRRLTQSVTLAQKRALEMAISGAGLGEVLDFLCNTVEDLAGSDVKMAILLIEGEQLRLASAPSIPNDYRAVIDGMRIGEGSGACGTAAYRGTHVVTTDVETDPLWAEYRDVALREGLRACWAAPVIGANGSVIALFAIYYDQPRMPSEADRTLVDFVGHTSSIVIETHIQIGERKRAEAELREEVEIGAAVNRVAGILATERDLNTIVQAVTDACTKLSEAAFGAFFYNVTSEHHEEFMLYTLSGAPRESFDKFPMPRNTEIFEPTFRGTGVLRLDDVTVDSRFGKNSPFNGMPEGHLPVRSYLAVPVISRSGDVHGGLFFGHPEPARFTERQEQHIVGLAAQTAIAIDNARLYDELHHTAERLTLAVSAAKLGPWSWDAASDVVTFSERAGEIFGIPAGPFMTWTEMQGLLHRDDREHAVSAVISSIESRSLYDVEYRVRRGDGSEVWVSAKGSAHYDAEGEVIGMDGVVQDISESKMLEAQLRERAAALVDADRRKDEFLATLAHELRNPLAPIRTGLDLLKMRGDDPTTLREMSSMMDRQVNQMIRLVDDLLDVSRITRGALTLKVDDTDLSTIVRGAVETVRPAIDAKRHALEINIPGEDVTLRADAVRLSQVLSNLLNNAARYTPPDGKIQLTAQKRDGVVEFHVVDNGIGIGAGDFDRIFDMFSQVDRVQNQATGGLGIGLTLAKRLVELHGGSMSVRSEGEGKGSSFTVLIPLLPRQHSNISDVPSAAQIAEVLKILVADDNEDAADVLKVMLTQLGHHVRVAYDGEQALAEAREFKPDVMILDLGMPYVDGCETARRVRQEEWGGETMLVALTGWGQPEDRNQTKEAGFDLHVTKPVGMAKLKELLESVTSRPRLV